MRVLIQQNFFFSCSVENIYFFHNSSKFCYCDNLCLGREFQREEEDVEKALSPRVQCLVLGGGDGKLVLEEAVAGGGR